MKSVKDSIAFVIYNKTRTKILAVQRPEHDDSLPNVWGLPAASLKPQETFEQAVIRAGKEKLGVTVEIVKMINEGTIERDRYTLHMKEYEVKIKTGTPNVPQADKTVTQYQQWKWSRAELLKEAAQKGSLCSRLYLQHKRISWD